MSQLPYILGPMRVPFLILAPACALLGIAVADWLAADWTAGTIQALHVVLVLVGALAAHISVNTLNEYYDFISGLDFKTQRTPFSGGSGTLPASPEKARYALVTGWVTLGLVALIGVYFIVVWGLWLLPLGLLGLLVILFYTPWLNRNVILCLIAPGLGFGTLMVMGSAFALTGAYSWTAFFASLVPFFLVSNLLLLNQFPDVEADRETGRRNLPIVAGRKTAALVYGIFLLLTYLSIVLGVLLGVLPPLALLGLGTLLLAVPAALNAYRFADQIEKLIPAMGMNVLINILTPLLVAIGLFVGR
jgi:1,4-dihydroxy-2-naphthoate octaprenyltransferase